MFDTFFTFKLLQKNPKKDQGDFIAEYVFEFKTNKRRYIAIAEEYTHKIFVIKFYPAHRKNDDLRFNLVLNDYEFAPIIRTCINIMLWLLDKEPMASFGYLASPTITKAYSESKSFTQRYRIYEYALDAFIPSKNFKRIENKNNSAVLLINKKNRGIKKFARNAIKMFIEYYPDLEQTI